jgi:hypothetical protein
LKRQSIIDRFDLEGRWLDLIARWAGLNAPPIAPETGKPLLISARQKTNEETRRPKTRFGEEFR